MGGGSTGLPLLALFESPPASDSAISLEESLEASLLIWEPSKFLSILRERNYNRTFIKKNSISTCPFSPYCPSF